MDYYKEKRAKLIEEVRGEKLNHSIHKLNAIINILVFGLIIFFGYTLFFSIPEALDAMEKCL